MKYLSGISYIDSSGNEVNLDSLNSSFDVGTNQTILNIKQENGKITSIKTRSQDCIIATLNITSPNTTISFTFSSSYVQAIDWGDGTFDTNSGSVGTTHTYVLAGTYKCLIYLSVTYIEIEAFMGCVTLTNIVIPNSITSMSPRAFKNCTNLKSIDIPDSVMGIGNYVFQGCTALTAVSIGNNVTQIGIQAFDGCTALKNVKFNSESQLTTIQYNAFYNCHSLTNFIIPARVTTIGDNVFRYCVNLTNVVIPNSVTTIGDNAFSWSPNLTIYYEGSSIPSGWSPTFNGGNYPLCFNAKDAKPFTTVVTKDINSESLVIIDRDGRRISKLNNVNGQISIGDDTTLFDCDTAGRLGLIGRRETSGITKTTGIRYYAAILDSSSSISSDYGEFYYDNSNDYFVATKSIVATRFNGTVDIAEYASSDYTKGTIEQRLTNLGFKQSSATLSQSTTTNRLTRQGNYVIGSVILTDNLSTTLTSSSGSFTFCTLPVNFRPKQETTIGVITDGTGNASYISYIQATKAIVSTAGVVTVYYGGTLHSGTGITRLDFRGLSGFGFEASPIT